MEIKMINLQRAEFKGPPKIKVKNRCDRLVRFADIPFQQLKVILSSGSHMLLCVPNNVGACS